MPRHKAPVPDKTSLGCAWGIGIAIIVFVMLALWFGFKLNYW